ncbi:MAG: anthranilate synthase component I family protein [Flavisolibacter sp.]
MNRPFTSFPVTDFNSFKSQMLSWANQFNISCFLDNHQYNIAPHTYECLLAVGAKHQLQSKAGNAFQQLVQFCNIHQDWIFGHFGYDLKNEIEDLSSENVDGIGFPDLFFFVPEIIIRLEKNTVSISGAIDEAKSVMMMIERTKAVTATRVADQGFRIKERFGRKEYMDVISSLQHHIHRGDCYEINFCQEFYAEDVVIDPLAVYDQLVRRSPNPFSCYYRLADRFLLCASPERYLKKTGTKLLSQPIKGTLKRTSNEGADETNRAELFRNLKERTENVMMDDLVRNDLSKVCRQGSVSVSELFGIYTFPQVYQMISSITGEIDEQWHWVDAVRKTFPMGSMTGAPKKKVMELIETHERTRRGIFSGAVGYVNPQMDFDFNVVIRSIMYNKEDNYLSYQAGSGITSFSVPEVEYEECLLKVEAIKKVLTRSAVGQHF